MIQENEVITLLLSAGVLLFILGNRPQLKKSFPAFNILFAGLYMLMAGWLLTVLEGFFWKDLLNLAEHICYAASFILVAAWCWKVFERKTSWK